MRGDEWRTDNAPGPSEIPLEGLRLVVTAGPDRGRALVLAEGTFVVGAAAPCDLLLSDRLVSRRHLEVRVTRTGVELTDLGSKNGSFFRGAQFQSIRVREGAAVLVGQSELRLTMPDVDGEVPISAEERLGDLLAVSPAMRRVFSLLERAAAADLSVLIEGETGTGKELAADAIHRGSGRTKGPFVICDLGAVQPGLIESDLFGHVKGAFTGADRDRPGAFEESNGGTIFLDEVGELGLELQPRLLRALERRRVKPVGSSRYVDVDVRVVAATNRNLEQEVAAGRFRADLFHRLAVIRIRIPPLRDRREDILHLVQHFLEETARVSGRPVPELAPQARAALWAHDWPGNVRELKNVIERAVALSGAESTLSKGLFLGSGSDEALDTPEADVEAGPPATAQEDLPPFREAKDRVIDAWERDYVIALLARHGANVSEAARLAGIDRTYLYRLMKKHHIGAGG